jgi:hypothetical protein
MENFLLGATAVWHLAVSELSTLAQSLLVRGFVAGYVVATLMFGFIYTRQREDVVPRSTLPPQIPPNTQL